MSLSRLLSLPKLISQRILAMNATKLRYFTDDNTPSTSNDNNDSNDDIKLDTYIPQTFDPDVTPTNYSSIINELPAYELGRKIRIYQPARNSYTQGTSKVGGWKVELLNAGQRWGNPLMGWTSTRDPTSLSNMSDFATKEAAIMWCTSNGILLLNQYNISIYYK